MFSEAVIGTDRFLDMSPKAQVLYLQLNMCGDDDGFVASPKKLCRVVRCSEKELRTLEEAGFILSFPSGVVCIVDWHLQNTLKNDRYTPTFYQEELHTLALDSSGRYFLREEQVVEEEVCSETEDTEEVTCREAANTAETALEPTENQDGTTLEPTRNQAGTKVEPQHNITKHNLTEHNIHSIAEHSEEKHSDHMGRASPSCVYSGNG
jgi:hypothetical protein